jgi:aprataxin
LTVKKHEVGCEGMFTKVVLRFVMGDFWRNGLIQKLKDSSAILLKSDSLVAIRDSYPKARQHFLVLPLDESLDTIYDLSIETIDLLDEFELFALNLIELTGNKKENFEIGFHMQPSMSR